MSHPADMASRQTRRDDVTNRPAAGPAPTRPAAGPGTARRVRPVPPVARETAGGYDRGGSETGDAADRLVELVARLVDQSVDELDEPEATWMGPLPFAEVRRRLADAGVARLLVDRDGCR